MLGALRLVATAAATWVLINKVVDGTGDRARKARRKAYKRAESSPSRIVDSIQPQSALDQTPVTTEPQPTPRFIHASASLAMMFCLVAAAALSMKRGMWDVACLLVTAAALLYNTQAYQGSPACSEEAPAPAPAAPRLDLTGTWVKDQHLSEPLDEALDLMRMNGLVRRAVSLIRGVRLEHSDTEFELAVFSIISWFKVVERYPMNGEERQWRRRDFRGKHTGHVRLEDNGRKVVLELNWNDPRAGAGTDEFMLVDEDTLHVRSTVIVDQQKAQYTVVYHRKQ